MRTYLIVVREFNKVWNPGGSNPRENGIRNPTIKNSVTTVIKSPHPDPTVDQTPDPDPTIINQIRVQS